MVPDSTPTAPQTHSSILAVVNKHLPGLTIYDAATYTQIAQMQTGIAPHEVALSPDGRLAYLPIYGSSGVGRPGTHEHMLHLFSTSDGHERSVLDTGEYKRLHSIVIGRSGSVYISAESAASVILVDPDVTRILGHIPTGSYTTHFIAVDENETKIYCSNVHSETVSILGIAERSLLATVPTGHANQRMTLSPDGRWFVTNIGATQQVAFYRTSDNHLDASIAVRGRSFVSKFSADGRFLFNAGMNDGHISVNKIDISLGKAVKTIDIEGGDIGSLEVNPFDGRVFVSDQPTNRVAVLDPDTLATITEIETAASPDAMAFARLA